MTIIYFIVQTKRLKMPLFYAFQWMSDLSVKTIFDNFTVKIIFDNFTVKIIKI
jgi:hypothetical protein